MGASCTTAVLLTGAILPSKRRSIVADAVLAAGAGLGVFVSVIATVGPGLELENRILKGFCAEINPTIGTSIWAYRRPRKIITSSRRFTGQIQAVGNRVIRNIRIPYHRVVQRIPVAVSQ